MEINFVKRQRLSGVWNGVIIGMGISYILAGLILGILPLVMGIGLEYFQRKRLDNPRWPFLINELAAKTPGYA